VSAGVTTAALVAMGWMTGLRDVMHGALLTLAIAALPPLAIVAGGLLLVMMMGFFFALAAALAQADDLPVYGVAEGVLKGGRWLIPRYYRFLRRQHHPVFWGVPAGLLFAGLLPKNLQF